MKEKNKSANSNYLSFFLACFCSILGLGIYLLGKHVIPFPDGWINFKSGNKLFFLGANIHISVNWALNFFFTIIEFAKFNREKMQKWRFWINKIAVLLFFTIYGLSNYWKKIEKITWYDIFILILSFLIISCIIDLIIQFMNNYGVCNGFNLFLFVEFLPTTWFFGLIRAKEILLLASLFSLTFVFVIFTNLKWEIPVESNAIHYANNPLLKKNTTKFGIKMNFSFMSFFQLSSFLSYIFIFYWMIKNNTKWTSFADLLGKSQSGKMNWDILQIFPPPEKKFGETFLSLGDRKGIFAQAGNWIKEKKWIVILALISLILLRWLVNWLSIRKMQLKTKDISKDLNSRGIYFDNIPPGYYTRKLLKKVINKLIFYWNAMILILNIAFDQIFSNYVGNFFSWFSSINLGIGLFQQIKTRFKYHGNWKK